MNKRGSSIVLLAMIFVSLMAAIVAAISITRALVVKSECESFGQVWAKAILSEYDVHLFEDYGIMAYQGDDKTIGKKLDAYMNYSCGGKLDASIKSTYANLCGYELADVNNFNLALKHSCASEITKMLVDGNARTKRESNREGEETRVIKNSVVLDTLPSRGMNNTIDIDSLVDTIKNGNVEDKIKSGLEKTSFSLAFMYRYLGNHVTKGDDKDSLFENEWEYIIMGDSNDESNYTKCRTTLFLLRNALNLASLYKDPTKVELVVAVAELITPGPAGALTQAVIAELWAAAETEEDMDALYNGDRVPLIKTADTWKTDLDSVIDSEEFSSKLDDEAKEQMKENKDEIDEKISGSGVSKASLITDGLNYEEHLMALMLGINENVRMLRIMDLVQINMKYRYYSDFNMQEYFIGVGFTIKANGRNYEFEEEYK